MFTESWLTEKMTTANNNAISVGLLLSILCLGMVFVGGLYLQSSIVELRALVTDLQEATSEQEKELTEQTNEILEQKKRIMEQTLKITKQEETIQQLQQKLYEQEQRLDKLSLELQFENSQSQVNIYMKCFVLNKLTDISLETVINKHATDCVHV